jgi:glycosyltransferase involved in cell wall biosynthesis
LKKLAHQANLFIGAGYAPSFVPVDYDIVYSISGAWLNLYGARISEFFSIPHVIRLRGVRAEVIKYQKRSLSTKFMLQKLHEDCLRSATLITPIADKLFEYLKGIGIRYEQLGEVVYNGVDIPAINSNNFPDKFSPLYAGRISKEKGSEFLLKLIKASPYTWKLTGEIQDKDFIVPTNAHYFGSTPFHAMPNFYLSGSVVCIPSYTEGFPNTLLEAYANGKPVVATREAIPEEVEIYGALCDQNIDFWLEQLKEIERDASYLGYQARLYARKFPWKNFGRGIRKQLDKALSIYEHNELDQK